MSANYWESSQGKHWRFKRSELWESPAFLTDLEFVTARERAKVKIHFAILIHKLGRNLNVRQQVVSTALVYFKRYYARNSFRNGDPVLIAPTCLYLASKVEECPVHIKTVVSEMKNVVADNGGFPHDPAKIAETEFYLLEEMSFFTIVYHPYRPLTMFCNDLNADPNFLQTAWMLVNDCYRSDIPLLHAPHMIALSSILIAAGLHEKNGQDATLTSAAAPPGLEKWFSELNVNVQELYQIVQELFEHFAVLKELKDEDCTAILAKVNREKVVVESGKTDHGSNFRTKQNT